MSDVSNEETPVVVEEEEITDLFTAVRKVLKNAMYTDGVVRGLHQVTKAIDGGHAQVVFLSESCNEAVYKKLIEALCHEKNVNLMTVPDKMQLGEWCGLCKIDAEGNATAVVKCSAAAIRDFGEETEGLAIVQASLKTAE